MASGSSKFRTGDVVVVVRDKCSLACECVIVHVRGREGTVVHTDSVGEPYEAAKVDFGAIPGIHLSPYSRWVHAICLELAVVFPDGVWIDNLEGG